MTPGYKQLRPDTSKGGSFPCCYLAGPMRGYEDFNYPTFNAAAAVLRDEGWTVFNPAQIEHGLPSEPVPLPLWRYMKIDLPMVCQSDAVFVLEGWEKSEGARIEVEVAFRLGIPVYRVRDGLEIDNWWRDDPYPFTIGEMEEMERAYREGERHPNSARFHEILQGLGELHDRKQQDYGKGDDPFANVRSSIEWGVPGWVGAMVRLNDKIKRLQTYAEKKSLANEGVEDSLRDIAVYAVIALVLWEQEDKNVV